MNGTLNNKAKAGNRFTRLSEGIGRPKFRRPKKPTHTGKFLLILLCLLAGFGGGLAGAHLYGGSNNEVPTSTAMKYVSSESVLISRIAEEVGQSVVSVDIQREVSAVDFFGFSRPVAQQSAGTGFIISDSGVIITNRHVVPKGTTSVVVRLADGTKFENVEVLGRSSDSSPQDIAFLKITDLKGIKLKPVKLGDSSKMKVGDRVVAIGNALGQFHNTVTSGIISGYGRDVTAGDESMADAETLTDLFQTDAAINQGNSGGPLVNVNGEVIGINTAMAAGAQNIGFAQPINDVNGLVSSVLTLGRVQQPYLGVRYVSLTDDIAYDLNLKTKRGGYVTSGDGQPAVVPGSPAEVADIQEKDIIIKVNNVVIDDKTSLTGAVGRFKPGDKVTLKLIRGYKTITVPVTLGALPVD